MTEKKPPKKRNGQALYLGEALPRQRTSPKSLRDRQRREMSDNPAVVALFSKAHNELCDVSHRCILDRHKARRRCVEF